LVQICVRKVRLGINTLLIMGKEFGWDRWGRIMLLWVGWVWGFWLGSGWGVRDCLGVFGIAFFPAQKNARPLNLLYIFGIRAAMCLSHFRLGSKTILRTFILLHIAERLQTPDWDSRSKVVGLIPAHAVNFSTMDYKK